MDKQIARRSCRRFSRDPIPKENIEKIVAAGRNYACGMLLENINFTVVTNLAFLDKLSDKLEEAMPEFHMVKRKEANKVTNTTWCDAPLVIFLTYRKDAKENYAEINAGDAAINLISAATDLGYGTLPVALTSFPGALKPIGEALGIPPEQVGMSVAIGKKHPDWKNDPKQDLTKIRIESSHDTSIKSSQTTKSSWLEGLNTRRSCRNYNPSKPVATKDLEQLALFAKSCPTGCDFQSFDILVVTKPEVITKAAKDTFDSIPAELKNRFGAKFTWEGVFYHAPAVFFIYEARAIRPDCTKFDLGIVTQSILNGASYLGYNATTIAMVTAGNSQKLKSDLGIPSESNVIAVCLGVPSDDCKLAPRELKSVAKFID